MPIDVKFLTLGGIIWNGCTECPICNMPASCSLGVEVYHILIPELSRVPVVECVL